MGVLNGYIPGALGRITELHGSFYHRRAGFGVFFESKVATELAEFLRRYDPNHDGIWLWLADDRVEGSVVIDSLHAGSDGAHLRWFIVSDLVRGSGAGNMLLKAAVEFCRMRQYNRVYLWTFAGLEAASHLYQKFGFRLTHEQRGTQWGREVQEQCFELNLVSHATGKEVSNPESPHPSERN